MACAMPLAAYRAVLFHDWYAGWRTGPSQIVDIERIPHAVADRKPLHPVVAAIEGWPFVEHAEAGYYQAPLLARLLGVSRDGVRGDAEMGRRSRRKGGQAHII